MITKEVFEKMQELYKVDRSLVNGLMSTLPYFEFMLFQWVMKATYEDYLNRAITDKQIIENTFSVVLDALRGLQ